MKTRTKFLLISIFDLLVFAFTGSALAAPADREVAGTRSDFDLSKIAGDVTKELNKAWRFARCGTANVEALVLIFKNADGSYRAQALAPKNEYNQFTFKWSAGVIAIIHTHPTNCAPRPTANDMRIADKYRVPMFTITRDGMFLYDPNTRKVTKVQNNLDWLNASKWNRKSQLAYAK